MNEHPNILVILSDQHSKHALGCYGNDIVRTPNLDHLAEQGMRFTDTYCAAPVCCPSRMSFMSSRTPSHNRVWNNQQILNPAIPTWAHTLGLAGYETSLMGRMHFEGHDQYHGFENRPIGEMFAVHPGCFRGEKYPGGQNRKAMELSGRGTTTYQWMDERVTETALDYITQHAQEPRGRPFAAVVGYVLPHCPFVAPKDLFNYYFDRVDIPPVDEDPPAMARWYRKSRNIDEPLSEHRIRVTRAAYFALCEYTDRLTGQLLDRLEQTGLAENTLVIYCSDHGEMAGEHGLWTKNTYYEGSASVPMIARLPGTVPAGTVSNAVCNLMDLGPTFADVAGATDLPNWDGRSLWPVLTDPDNANWKNETFSEVVDETAAPHIPSRMIRSDQWKLWVDQEVPGESPNVALFNLEDDPGELHNLADDPAHAEIRARLLNRVLDGWDPDRVRTECLARSEDYKMIVRWTRNHYPTLPEQLPAPPPEIEDDVEIL
ncbi:MAG: sulfatase-like hydrolase/transferase [bacterium]|nr:sulfatase-like hydrolase/transferase [bacterium]